MIRILTCGLILFAGMCFLSGCNLFDTKICTDKAVVGITLSIVDAETGGAIATFYGTVADGDYVEHFALGDTTTVASPLFPADQYLPSAKLAEERAGTYTVTVRSPGYETWQQDNVLVELEETGCHVQTNQVLVRLNPAN